MPKRRSIPTLTKNSAAVKLLTAKLSSGELSGKENPKLVWESDPIFKAHDLSCFRTRYYKVRRDVQDKKRTEQYRRVVERGRNRAQLAGMKLEGDTERVGGSQRGLSEEMFIEGSEHYRNGQVSGGKKRLVERKGDMIGSSFTPIHLISKWRDVETWMRRVTVAVVLPSGITGDNYSTRVCDDGQYLEVVIPWPSPMCDVTVMHKKWMASSGEDRMEKYHPKIMGFEESLRKMGGENCGKLESTARIQLPFAVEREIVEEHMLTWKENGTIVIYVDLEADSEDA